MASPQEQLQSDVAVWEAVLAVHNESGVGRRYLNTKELAAFVGNLQYSNSHIV